MANAVLNLSDLNGSNGFVISGIDTLDRSGGSVSSAGDINGDGFDDVIIGADGADHNGQIGVGESYVVFGSSSGFEARFNLLSLNGSNGFVINGIDNDDYSGGSVSSAGDINGDGFDDLIIGADSADANGQFIAGESYVVFGSNSGFGASFNLSSLNGSNGFVISGIDSVDRSGGSVSSAGDINGDGFDDLIIGAAAADPNGQSYAGESYVVFGSSSDFGAQLNLSSLNGSNGFVINGIDTDDRSGVSVSNAGDINGDGFDDLIIGASGADPNGQTGAGESYVVFGSSSGFDAQLNLSSLNGSNGFVINGIDNDDFSGNSVSTAGDINGDGFDDLIIGASGADPNGQFNAGESYVVFGSNGGFSTLFNLSSLNGSNGFVINGINFDNRSGVSVSSAGDINGDGFDDLIIGVVSSDFKAQYNAGESYVVFGRSSSFGAGFNLSSLDGSEGFVIKGIDESGLTFRSGSFVSSAGDINGDGFDDLIIGASSASPNGQSYTGQSYVVFGFASPTPTNRPPVAVNDTATTDEDTAVNVEVLANDSNFLTVTAIDGKTFFVGTPITLSSGALITVNADSSLTYDPNAQFESLGFGESVNDSFTYTTNNGSLINTANVNLTIKGVNDAPKVISVFNLSSLNGSNGFVINGIAAYDNSGISVSSAGDINGDGFDDLIIGATGADLNGQQNAGSSYVVFGSNSGFDAQLNLSALNGSNGFVINGINAGDFSGFSVSSAGDINGDGFDDLIIGASNADPNGQYAAGSSYVVFGSNSGFDAQLNLSTLNGSNGFVINGIDQYDNSGFSVSSAGDINGDGFDDLIIGARFADPNGQFRAGSSYVVFGSNSGFDAQLNLSTLNGSNGFVINGINADDNSGFSVSSAGDINGDGFDDLIIGARYVGPNGQSGAGSSYVVFGSNSGFDAQLNLSTLNGSNGFVINGINADDNSGFSVSSAGDINGDGFDDLIIGARFADPNGQFRAGSSYVVFGSNSGFDAQLNLSTLNGSNGFVINGIDELDLSGGSVSSAGDINGDGFDDLIIGAINLDPNGQAYAGSSYVVFGSNSSFDAQFNLSTLNSSNGFVINGINAYDFSGGSVSSAGDINGDGFDDLIIGASNADPNGQYAAGSSYVVFGFQTAATTNEDTAVNILASNILRRYTDIDGDTLTISDFTSPTNGTLSLNDNNTPDNPGDDFFIYTPNANFNGTDSFNFTVSDGNGGNITNTFNLNVKPVNNAPIAVNDRLTTGFNTAVTILATTLLANDTDIDSTSLSITGVSGATNGTAVLNNNGTPGNSTDDFIVFTPINGFSGNANFNYTISDGSLTSTARVAIAVGANISGGAGNDNISAGEGNDNISGGGGNDTIAGNGGDDTISGGGGNDNISGGNGNDLLLGGNANDTIAGDEGNDNISGGNGNDLLLGGNANDTIAGDEGNDNISGGNGNDLLLGGNGSDTIAGGDGNDTIIGGNGNDLLLGGNGNDTFVLGLGDGNDTIADFTGTGIGSNPSATVISQLDTLQFIGSGLTARNLQLTQNGDNLELTFLDAASTKVTLQNFQLENLDNLSANGSRPAIGNILFDGQTSITDSFDVFNANSTQTNLFNKNTVTFLNDLNNNIAGFDNSNDVINGQKGNDIINGNSGNDLLRGGEGDDILIGGEGNDTVVGGKGNDVLVGGVGADLFVYNSNADFVGVDVIADFQSSKGDKIVLDKTTFSTITSAAGTGFSNITDFQITSSAATSTAKIVYDPLNGELFYNQNGSAAGFGSGGLFATLTGSPTLTASDFVLQA
ncbi:beta strand repeat-containing protein [Nostoc sp. C110]|uniref:beta strand repeat-containing protein n=1 Tax=Nostoc sp. C110 TaxID=3349876 RepID=UPI00370D6C0E